MDNLYREYRDESDTRFISILSDAIHENLDAISIAKTPTEVRDIIQNVLKVPSSTSVSTPVMNNSAPSVMKKSISSNEVRNITLDGYFQHYQDSDAVKICAHCEGKSGITALICGAVLADPDIQRSVGNTKINDKKPGDANYDANDFYRCFTHRILKGDIRKRIKDNSKETTSSTKKSKPGVIKDLHLEAEPKPLGLSIVNIVEDEDIPVLPAKSDSPKKTATPKKAASPVKEMSSFVQPESSKNEDVSSPKKPEDFVLTKIVSIKDYFFSSTVVPGFVIKKLEDESFICIGKLTDSQGQPKVIRKEMVLGDDWMTNVTVDLTPDEIQVLTEQNINFEPFDKKSLVNNGKPPAKKRTKPVA